MRRQGLEPRTRGLRVRCSVRLFFLSCCQTMLARAGSCHFVRSPESAALCGYRQPHKMAGPGSYRHRSAADKAEERTKQRTLNLRVRGSSPWRRTHSDLGICPFRAPSCRPFRGHACSTFARQSGPSPTGRAGHPPRPLPMALHSVTSTGRPSSRARTPSGDILSSRSRRSARTARPQTGLAMARRRPRAAFRRAVTPKIACRVHEGYMRGPLEVYARYIRLLAPGYRTGRRRAGPRLARRHRVAARSAERWPARLKGCVLGLGPISAGPARSPRNGSNHRSR